MHFEIYKARDGYRWRLRALNGEPIADSAESYIRIEDCEYGIKLIRENAILARVEREA